MTVVGGLGALFLLWALHSVSGQGNFLYQGGFLLVAAASAAVILLVVVEPRALLARALGGGCSATSAGSPTGCTSTTTRYF